MKIGKIEAFDLYGDGTVVLKTNMAEGGSDLRFAWYIMRDQRTIFKSPYQKQPYRSWKLYQYGKYTIKAFVKNGQGEKVRKETAFTFNRRTSPKLKNQADKLLHESPVIEKISGPFYRMYVGETLSKDAKYAWYIYQVGAKEPIVRQMYTNSSEYIHAFRESGEYYVKVFVMLDGAKESVKSEPFQVKL